MKSPEQNKNNMLNFVTKYIKIRQLLIFTSFIIHVDSECMGGNAHA